MTTAIASSAEPLPIAIIGMACIFPGAADLRTFWNNILLGVDAVGEPLDAWGASRYLDSGRIETQSGGFLRDLYRFDATAFGIMPNSINGSEPDQFLALRVAHDALEDAGYTRPDADHSTTGIILGHSTYLHRGQGTLIQQNIVLDQTMDILEAAMPHLDAAALLELRAILQKKLPPTNADTVPGLVPNVMTGRIANRLNLKGPNFLIDAACSSSLLAVGAAIDELRTGRSRMMLAGGVNATLPAEVTTIFTQLGALSKRRKVRPFSVGSDGTLLGEGLGVIVLKRLADAIADGDRVYSVLRGVGQSSDGRGSGMLAPSHEGETLAIRRTYEASGTDPATIGLFEAHGTGIPLGDQTEIQSLKAVFGARTTPVGVIALGSVKSMISHCIPAAGIASLIKTSLAVHHKILPPTLCEEVNPALGIDDTPFYVNTKTAPWISSLDKPRRAAVNAFGFGGTNAHAILEEAPTGAITPTQLTGWPAEICVLSADTAEELADKLGRLAGAVTRNPGWRLPEIAAALAREDRGAQHRIAIVAKDVPALMKHIGQSQARLRDDGGRRWPSRGAVAYGDRRLAGKLAFVFPGEGSQYQGMFADLAVCFPAVRRWLDFWHGLYGLARGQTRTDTAFPTSEIGADERRRLEQRLHEMDIGSEAVYIGGLAMHDLMVSCGITPDVMLGHSSGESAALTASGANPAGSPSEQAACIARHHAVYRELLAAGSIPSGALLAVGALDTAIVEAKIAELGGVVVAMDNCSNQVVLYGSAENIARIQASLTQLGGVCLPLPFDRGYHTPDFAQASAAFLQYYAEINLQPAKIPLYSCSSAGLFPDDAASVRELAAGQWATKVRFRETIRKMHDDGVSLFVEVGPSSNLTAFIQDILGGREFMALSTNVRRRNDVEQVLQVMGQLFVAGRGADLQRMFATRAIPVIDLDATAKPRRDAFIDNTMPMIRLSAEERAAIRRIAAAPAAAPENTRGLAVAATSIPAREPQAPSEALENEGGAQTVMHEYLDVMRGFLNQQKSMIDGWLGSGGSLQAGLPGSSFGYSTHANDSVTPLLDEIIEHDELHVVARSEISLANDNFVRDHVMTGPVSDTDPPLFGLSCVPLAVSMELMAEACSLLAGRTDVAVIQDIRAFDWIALDEDTVVVEVTAEVVDQAAGHFKARVATARGTALSADFIFEPDWRLQPLPALLERRESCWNAPDLYTTGMFHGPVFQSLKYIDAWDDSGIDVELSDGRLENFFIAGHTPRLILNSVLLDAIGQVVACWLVQFFGTEFNNFPSTIDRIELYEPCPAGRHGIIMKGRQHPVDGVSTDPGAPRAWEFECVDGNGRVLLRGRGLINVFWQMPPAYHAVRWRPLAGWLGHAVPPASGTECEWHVPVLGTEFLLQSGAICLRTLAHVFLNTAERDEWRALKGTGRTRIDWLFGRAAIKEAVRYWIHERTGRLLYPSDVAVAFDTQNMPTVDGWWRDHLSAAPQVSLTQTGEICRAVITSLAPSTHTDEQTSVSKEPIPQ